MIKKVLACFLTLTLVISLCPAIPVSAAELAKSNTLVADSDFEVSLAASSPSFSGNVSGVNDPSAGITIRQQDKNTQLGWALAAVAAVEQHTDSVAVSENHIRFALSNTGSNTSGFVRGTNAPASRGMVTAYLMRGSLGGIVSSGSDPYVSISTSRSMSETAAKKPFANVDGVAYIPGISDSVVTAVGREKFNGYVRYAVDSYDAVVASFYFDDVWWTPAVEAADAVPEIPAVEANEEEDTPAVDAVPGTPAVEAKYASYDRPLNTKEIEVKETVKDEDGKTTTTTTIKTVAAEPNHSVVIVGYNSDGFIVKDSLRPTETYTISYATPIYECYAVTGVTDVRTGASNKALPLYTYEYDKFGVTASGGDKKGYFANVFTATTAAEVITDVSFFATSVNTKYTVYAIPIISTTDMQTELKKAATGADKEVIASGTMDLPGYYKIPVSASKALFLGAKGSRFAVIVEVETPYNAPIPLQGRTSTASPTASAGQSYMSGDGVSWTDTGASYGANACIKVHTEGEQTIATEGIGFSNVLTDDTDGAKYIGIERGKTIALAPVKVPLNGITPEDGKVEYVFSLGDSADSLERVVVEAGETKAEIKNDNFTLTHDGKLTAHGIESAWVGVEMVSKANKSNVLHRYEVEVRVNQTPVESVTLNKKTLTLKTNAKGSITATILPSNTSVKTVEWEIYSDEACTTLFEGDKIPITITESGSVTGAHPGKCWVKAVSKSDGITKSEEACEITVELVPVTGISTSTKKLSVSVDTVTPFSVAVKPSNAYEQGVTYTSSDNTVAEVVDGALVAKTAGTAKLTCRADANSSYTAEIMVTVVDSLSAVLKPGASKSLKLTGAASSDAVEWSVTDESGGEVSNMGIDSSDKATAKLTCSAASSNIAKVTATQYEKDEEGKDKLDENNQRIVKRYQVWTAAGATPITKQQIVSLNSTVVKSLTLSVTPGADDGEIYDVVADIVKPENPTDLGYTWTVNKPELLDITPLASDNQTNAKQKIKAKGLGTVKLTGTNRNGNKKVTLSVKILCYPTSVDFKKAPERLAVGKSVSIRTEIAPKKNVNKTLTWTSSDESVATVNAKGKVTAIKEGTVTITATSAGGITADTTITCLVPAKSVALSSSAGNKIEVGGTTTLTAVVNPDNTTQKGVTWASNSSAVTLEISGNSCVVTGASAGKASITAITPEGKKKTISITVKRS